MAWVKQLHLLCSVLYFFHSTSCFSFSCCFCFSSSSSSSSRAPLLLTANSGFIHGIRMAHLSGKSILCIDNQSLLQRGSENARPPLGAAAACVHGHLIAPLSESECPTATSSHCGATFAPPPVQLGNLKTMVCGEIAGRQLGPN